MTTTPNTPSPRPDVEGIRQRLLDACVGKPAKVPWPHRLLHDAADYIEALEARQVKLEAVVEAARAMDAGWRGAGPAGQAIMGYWCEYCGEGHAERPKILHSALCKIFQFNQRLAALGDGDG